MKTEETMINCSCTDQQGRTSEHSEEDELVKCYKIIAKFTYKEECLLKPVNI